MTESRLLVSLKPNPRVEASLRRNLPALPWEYVNPGTPGPWAAAEALLTSHLVRELPQWEPRLAPRLKFVQRLWTGLDGFPFVRFPAPISVAGNVGAFAPSVSEHAVALLLCLAQALPGNHELIRKGRMSPTVPKRELRGRTALLLGFGEIARQVAQRLRPFGVTIDGLSRSGSPEPGVRRMFAAAALKEALTEADFVIDCRPLTTRTTGTIDRAMLASMKPAAIYVNVGRAGVVDQEALYRHLVEQPEFRVGLDVWWNEDPVHGTIANRFPFGELPNLIGSPHNADEDADNLERSLEYAARNLARFFEGSGPLHVADREEYPA